MLVFLILITFKIIACFSKLIKIIIKTIKKLTMNNNAVVLGIFEFFS